MIRDPSDGTVKEIMPQANEINPLTEEIGSKEIISALPPTTTKPSYLERLAKSREWLKEYHIKALTAGENHGAD